MNKPIYKFFADPGHGWLEVPMKEITRLGIYSKISPYSYRKEIGGVAYAYLEEDCDYGIFANAVGPASFDVEHIHLNGEAAIRNYPRMLGRPG